MPAQSNINIGLSATNRATPVIQQVQGSLRGLNSAAGLATGGLATLAGAAGVGALMAVAGQVGSAATEIARMAAASESVGNAFRTMAAAAGQSAAGILGELQRISGGTISEYELMLSANRAMMLGVADSAEEMNALMAVAMSRGRAMGLSTAQAFGDLVTGLGRASPLILDNLGIVVDAESLYTDYAAQIGTTADALDEAQKKQALVNQVMKEAETVDLSNVEGMASSFERAQASIADMKAALGELFGPAIAGIADTLARAVTGVSDALNTDAAEQVLLDIAEARAILQDAESRMYADQTRAAYASMAEMPDSVRTALAEYETRWSAAQQAMEAYYASFVTRQSALMGGGGINPAAGIPEAVAASTAALAESHRAAALEALAVWNGTYGEIAQMAMRLGEGLTGIQINSVIASAVEQFNILTASGYTADAAMQQVGATVAANIGRLQAMGNAAAEAAVGAQTAGTAVEFLGLASGGAGPAVGALAAAASAAALEFFGLGNAATDAAAKMQSALNVAVTGQKNLNRATEALASAQREGTRESFDFPAFSGAVEEAGAKTGALVQKVLYMPPAMKAAGASVGGLSNAVRAANSEMSALTGKVSGVLNEALRLDVGIDPAAFLPRPDAVNENARRLADIMANGFKGQSWLDEFASEVPDIYAALHASGDPRAEAARLLQDFQAGLVPALIDKEAAKERVRQMILGDRNVASMAQEIAAELSAELGISMGQAQAAAMHSLGVALPTGSGEKGGGSAQGLDGAAEGGKFMSGFIQSVNGALAGLRASGAAAGASWGEGFLGAVSAHVPGALVSMLTSLVGAALATQESQTGATP